LPGKDQPTRQTWLDGSLAWVLTEIALLRMHNICVQQPASQAILRRSARSIPMFRADFLPFASKIVEHSRYLPLAKNMFARPQIALDRKIIFSRVKESQAFRNSERLTLAHLGCSLSQS
jgi:hypothetical protein